MSFFTEESKYKSFGSRFSPLYTGKRVYRSEYEVKKRIYWLQNEYGAENIWHEPKKGDPATTLVYVRID